MINDDKIISTIASINDNCFENLNKTERLLVISNLLLTESINYLPPELKEKSVDLVSNGKAVAYEMIKHQNNLGLDLAFKAHLIIKDVNNLIEGNV